jgi:hypothetical protein
MTVEKCHRRNSAQNPKARNKDFRNANDFSPNLSAIKLRADSTEIPSHYLKIDTDKVLSLA